MVFIFLWLKVYVDKFLNWKNILEERLEILLMLIVRKNINFFGLFNNIIMD